MPQINYINLDSVDSTNTYAKSVYDYPSGDDWMTVIRASRQHGGRGRFEKTFFSDHDGGLWVSIVTPVDDIGTHFAHNRAVSLAIVGALKNICAMYNVDTDTSGIKIKWPNDIFWGDKKIAGILLENVADKPNMLIIGFGVNVNICADDFPNELRDVAGSVYMKTGVTLSIDNLLDDIVTQYIKFRGDVSCHKIYHDNLYGLKSSATINDCAGEFAGVEEDGRARIKTGAGIILHHTGTLRFTNCEVENDDK